MKEGNRRKMDIIGGIGIILGSLSLGYFSFTFVLQSLQNMPGDFRTPWFLIIAAIMVCFLVFVLLGAFMVRDGIKKR